MTSLQEWARKPLVFSQGLHGLSSANTHALCYHLYRRTAFTYRLYPHKEQRCLRDQPVEECRWLYNRLLEARQRAGDERQEALRLYDQHAMLSLLTAERPSLARVQSQVLQHVAVRSDLAF
jgi:hypothetical protein